MLTLLASTISFGQGRPIGGFAIGFYNLENLFDTQHDPGKNDFDFLPDGSYHWDEHKYKAKLANMSRVLSEMGTERSPKGATIIGVSEVENSHAMDDLVAQPVLKQRGYKYIHIEGPDKRGVDCALIYNPEDFHVEKYFLPHYVYENGDTTHATRGFLTVQGRLGGEKLTVIVCHWPSRGAEGKFRDWGGKQVRALTDSISAADPEQHIIVMGDMNDDPDNSSMAKFLGAKRKESQVKEGDFFNPWWEVLRGKGQGTLSYQGGWNLFDQIVVSKNMIDGRATKSYKHLTLHSWQIFRRDYMIQQSGRFKGSPLRTHAAGAWMNGFSDHLPTVIYLAKEL